MAESRYDAVIVGGGHNGLVAATLLARAGLSVLVLERRDQLGGAAVSGAPFPGVDVRLSRYAYLVSLFPAELLRQLGVKVDLRVREVASYTPAGDSGVLVTADRAATAASMTAFTGDPAEHDRWEALYAMLARVAERLFPTMLEPLRSRGEMRKLVGDDGAWTALFEEPLSGLLRGTFESDLLRGIVLTDATIGTFAAADDPLLRQNRCFLYHVIGNGTGRWDVPAGGMGALTGGLADAARASGAELRTGTVVTAITTDGEIAELECAGGERIQARDVLANLAPAPLARLVREGGAGDDRVGGAGGAGGDGGADRSKPGPEGSQLKINMLLRGLPPLRDPAVTPEQAFAGTFHVNESYEQLQVAYAEAAAGEIPSLPPCEVYCHSLTDPSILSAELRSAGAHTLTLFGLHMPARLFSEQGEAAKSAAVAATMRSVDSVLAEPLEDHLLRDGNGDLCIEVLTPPELEAELAMPGGHIFHRDLAWPFAETDEEVGTWGVETDHANVWICGAGAKRGGGVSGIPGHNAARAVLASRR